MVNSRDKHSAGAQGLGYFYQPRLALLRILQLPEDVAVFIEKEDDLDFVDAVGGKTLASLKHKAAGDRLTDLSTDFWRSVRIWLKRYKSAGGIGADMRFFLFTTSDVSPGSFLSSFVTSTEPTKTENEGLVRQFGEALGRSHTALASELTHLLKQLSKEEQDDFVRRITIMPNSPRIEEIGTEIITRHMRAVPRQYRSAVFQRLESWWHEEIIKLLTGSRVNPLVGYEVSDKLSHLADEYRTDNLPIEFRDTNPPYEIDAESDSRLFVVQLRYIGLSTNRIRSAILDYYRAFEQRSSWARGGLVISGEIEEYENRLVDEWERYRDFVFEDLDAEAAEDLCIQAGKKLYSWADFESGTFDSLRIRDRVTEPYVIRGGFHILANIKPSPRVYWHPHFMKRISTLLGVDA
jgi:hypothetical protein